MIFMEEAFKKLEAKFGRPSKVSVDSQEDLLDDEIPGLEDVESSCSEGGSSISEVLSFQIDSEKETHKMLDNLPEQYPCESSLIDKVSGNDDYNSHSIEENTGSCSDELLGAEDVGDVQSDKLVVQIEAESGKIVSPVASCSVLDELTEPDNEEMPHPNSINLDAGHGSCNDMSFEEHGDVDKVLESRNQEASELKLLIENIVVDLLATLHLPEYPCFSSNFGGSLRPDAPKCRAEIYRHCCTYTCH